MAIFVECRAPGCHARNSLQNQKCRKCGVRIPPTGRIYWLELRIDGKKKTERLGMISLQTAKEVESKRIMEFREGKFFPKPKAPVVPTWGEVVKGFLRKIEIEGRNEAHQENCSRYLRRMSETWGDSISVSEITPVMIREFRLSLLERGLSKTSCDLAISSGKAAWNSEIDGLINPFLKIKNFNVDNRITRYLSVDERARLLKAAKQVSQSLYEIICVALGTGFRKSNVLRLQRSEVDFELRMITVRQKGDIRHQAYLTEDLLQILSGIPHNGTPFFWVSPRTREPYLKSWKTAWIKAKTIAGIDPAFRFHDLRHDYGTRVYAATHDFRITQQLLGHQNMQTTTRYAHTMPDYLVSATEAANPLRGLVDELSDNAPPTNEPTSSKLH
jgi:integrase